MSSDMTGKHAAQRGAGLLDRLVVRHDVATHGGPPLMPFAVMAGIVAVAYPLTVATRSWPVAVTVLAALLIFMVWLVIALIRVLYCAANLYLSHRWLAAGRAAFGDEAIDLALEQLCARRSPDDVLYRRDLIEAIAADRQGMRQACKAARGVRMRDAMGQG